MQARELINYIDDPTLLDRQSVTELQKLVNQFPYFQSAHLLLSMASKKWDASVYQQSLKKAAIVASNRTHLFNLVHELGDAEAETDTKIAASPASPPLQEPRTRSEQELDILKGAEIAAEPFVEAPKPVLSGEALLEQEIAKQVVVSFVEKEIIKTPDLHNPVVAEDKPENFSDWLLFLKKNNGQAYEKIEEEVKQVRKEKKEEAENASLAKRKEKNRALIDKIIDSNPGSIRVKEEQKFYTPDTKAKESLLENEHLVTETLAKIYALQGNINKAIRAYEILSLKFPQKSAYFASLIQKLKNN